jgi:drug/metabolite transporter (DMT)-like permease
MDDDLPRQKALLLFAIVVLAWGVNWAVTKALVQSISPLWTSAIRSGIATVALLIFQLLRGQLIVPRRGDVPVIVAISMLHMVAFATLIAFGLQLAPVGRSIVLGYTTPLWVGPGAWLFLREPMTKSRLAGIALGLLGLVVMFNPLGFDWGNRDALMGDGLVLLAAFFWAANILYVRAHKWISTPSQLMFWQTLLATVVLSILAVALNVPPHVDWNARLISLFLYAGVVGVALAYWAMAVVNRSLPAVTTSLGILATPVVGLVISAIAFGEPISLSLVAAMAMILGGIALGTLPGKQAPAIKPLTAVQREPRRA